MNELVEQLVSVIELMMAHLTHKHIQATGAPGGLIIQVVEFPEGHRPAKHVRFGIGAYQGDRVIRAS